MQFAPAELVFMQRMLPFFEAGQTVEQAAASVIERDQQIVSAVMDWSYSGPTAERRAEIRSAIAQDVYTKIRSGK